VGQCFVFVQLSPIAYTDLKSGPMAMNAVLDTAELLVGILQELDIQTLQLARRVSRKWLDTVRSSPELQESLYYKNRPNSREDPRYLWNPLRRRIDMFGQNGLTADPSPIFHTSTRLLALTSINPLFIEKRLHLGVDVGDSPIDQGQRVHCVPITKLLKHPNGAWQSMFLSQPHATRVLGWSVMQRRLGDRTASGRTTALHHCFILEDSAGVRMSQVVKEVLSIAQELGGGVEGISELRVNEWRLTFPDYIDLSDEQSLELSAPVQNCR
jgi:hypothetical protein